MTIEPIRNDKDYREALEKIEALMGAGANSVEGEQLDALARLVEAWESEQHSVHRTKGEALDSLYQFFQDANPIGLFCPDAGGAINSRIASNTT